MLEAHRVVLPLRVFLVLLFGILVVLRQATTLRTDMEAVI